MTSTRLREGKEVALGARFTNRNAHGELEWVTHGEVVRFDVQRRLTFRIEENWMLWSFELERTAAGGTLLTQCRDAPDGLSDLSHELTEAYMGGREAFDVMMRDGMRQTLERIRVACEQGATTPGLR